METLGAPLLLEWASGYRPALIAATVLCLFVLTQTVLGVIFGFIIGHEEPGGKLRGGYGDFGFRTLRTYQNSTETVAVFAFSLLLAMIVGANSSWINWLAVFYVIARSLHWLFYYAGVGPNVGGPRTMAFVLAWAINIGLIVAALLALSK